MNKDIKKELYSAKNWILKNQKDNGEILIGSTTEGKGFDVTNDIRHSAPHLGINCFI